MSKGSDDNGAASEVVITPLPEHECLLHGDVAEEEPPGKIAESQEEKE